MFCRVYVFYVQQHQVGKAQEFFHICIHEIAVSVQSGVYSFFFEKTEQRYEFAGMYQRLSSGYGNSSFVPEICFGVHNQAGYFLKFRLMSAFRRDGIWIVAVCATESAPLGKYYESYARAVVYSERL